MTDIQALRALLHDSFRRARELVDDLTTGLSPAVANYRPDPEANSISWLIWHSARVQDDHVADLAGVEQAWPAWRDRFGLPFDPWTTGYGHTSTDVGRVDATGELLAGYYHDVDALTRSYVDQVTESELNRIVDSNWDPPVSAGVRLISVIGDITQHLGQAGYVRGLADRAGPG